MPNLVTIPLTPINTSVNIPFVVSRPNDQQDINYWLTDAQIADCASLSPTGDYGALINMVLAYLNAKYIPDPLTSGQVNPANGVASLASVLKLHKTYPHSQGIRLFPGQGLIGDNDVDTRLIRLPGVDSTTDGPGILVLARNGSAANALARQAMISNLTLIGNASQFNSDGTRQNGLDAQKAVMATDPGFVGSSAYNSFIAYRVRVYHYSGHGITADKTRDRPKLQYCFVTGCGTVKPAPDGSDYGDGINFGTNADIDIAFCASGGNGGHSVAILGGDTPQIHGGDFWPSKNPSGTDFKRSIYINGSLHFIVDGPDVNGAVEYDGPTVNGTSINAKGRWTNINFRFREVSFGGGDNGNLGTLPAYIITKNAHGILSTGNTFEPSLDGSSAADAWPTFIYQVLGNASMYCNDALPSFADPLWPSGKTLASDLGTEAMICNDMTKCTGIWQMEDSTLGVVKTLFSYGAFMDGLGMIGSRTGNAPGTGCWGEYLVQKLSAGQAVACPAGTPGNALNVTTLALGAGDFDVEADVQFTGNNASGTLLSCALSNDSNGTNAQMIPPAPGSYAACGYTFTSVTGPLQSFHLYNRMNTAGTMTNRNGTVATAQSLNVQVSGSGVSVFGQLRATRRAH